MVVLARAVQVPSVQVRVSLHRARTLVLVVSLRRVSALVRAASPPRVSALAPVASPPRASALAPVVSLAPRSLVVALHTRRVHPRLAPQASALVHLALVQVVLHILEDRDSQQLRYPEATLFWYMLKTGLCTNGSSRMGQLLGRIPYSLL